MLSPRQIRDVEMQGLLWRTKRLGSNVWMISFTVLLFAIGMPLVFLVDWSADPALEILVNFICFPVMVVAAVGGEMIEMFISDRYYGKHYQAIEQRYEAATAAEAAVSH